MTTESSTSEAWTSISKAKVDGLNPLFQASRHPSPWLPKVKGAPALGLPGNHCLGRKAWRCHMWHNPLYRNRKNPTIASQHFYILVYGKLCTFIHQIKMNYP